MKKKKCDEQVGGRGIKRMESKWERIRGGKLQREESERNYRKARIEVNQYRSRRENHAGEEAGRE